MTTIAEPGTCTPPSLPPSATPSRTECQPPAEGMGIWPIPDAEPDAEPPVTRATATRVQGPAMPVRECPWCNAAVGLMLPSEIVCPRRPNHG